LAAKENGFLPGASKRFILSFEDFLPRRWDESLFCSTPSRGLTRSFSSGNHRAARPPDDPVLRENLDVLTEEVLEFKEKNYAQCISCAAPERAKRIQGVLFEKGLGAVVAPKK
jgi:hypothetical protein